MKRDIINMTPHSVNIVNDGGETVYTVPASGTVWRVDSKQTKFGEMVLPEGKVPLYIESDQTFDFGGMEPEEGGHYVVSRPMATALVAANKPGVFYIPGEQVRNEAGQVIGCKSFILETSKD